MTVGVGYEKTRFMYSNLEAPTVGTKPDQYQAYRVRHGRYVAKSPLFDTEVEADDWIESQRGLDQDDKDRGRVPPKHLTERDEQ